MKTINYPHATTNTNLTLSPNIYNIYCYKLSSCRFHTERFRTNCSVSCAKQLCAVCKTCVDTFHSSVATHGVNLHSYRTQCKLFS